MGTQVPPLVHGLPLQSAKLVTVQAPVVTLQHAPVGCVQGLVGVQGILGPCQTLGLAQSTCRVMVQAPVV